MGLKVPGIKINREAFLKKAIPVVGGVVGGGLTFASFKPCCDKLRKVLQDTMLSNPNYIVDESVGDIIEIETDKIIEE